MHPPFSWKSSWSFLRACFCVVALLASPARGQDPSPDPPSPVPAKPARVSSPEIDKALKAGSERLAAGRLEKAIESFERADRLAEGQSFAALFGLAAARYRTQELSLAKKAAEGASALAGSDAERGAALSLMGQIEVAVAGEDKDALAAVLPTFEKALQIKGPHLPTVRLALGQVLARLGNPGGAVASLRELIANLPPTHALSKSGRQLLCNIRAAHPELVPPKRGSGTEEEQPRKVEGDVQEPERVYTPDPAYPPEAKETGTRGKVVIQAILDREGCVVRIQLLEGHPMLNQSALDAFKRWVFLPATLDGIPVDVYFNLTANFNLS